MATATGRNPAERDPGEPGIGGVTVILYQDNDNNGIYSIGDKFLAATTTDPSGAYLFAGLERRRTTWSSSTRRRCPRATPRPATPVAPD